MRHIDTHEGINTTALILKDIILRSNGKIISGEGEGEIGKTIPFVALN